MRPVNLILISLALGGLVRPAHVARAQAPSPSGTVITIAGNGFFSCSGNAGLAADVGLTPLRPPIGPDGALDFADGGEFSSSPTNWKA